MRKRNTSPGTERCFGRCKDVAIGRERFFISTELFDHFLWVAFKNEQIGPKFLSKRDSPSCRLSLNYIRPKPERFLLRQRSQSLTIAVSNHNSHTCLPNIFKYCLIEIYLINTSWRRVPSNLRRWGSHRPQGWGRNYPLKINQCLWCYGDNLWKWMVLLACSDLVSAIPNSPHGHCHFIQPAFFLVNKEEQGT